MKKWVTLFLVAVAAGLLNGCAGGGGGGGGAAMRARQQQIMNEPVGAWYIGRRYYTQGTRFWGYLRRPRQGWDQAQLVIFNERNKKQPDRLPEYDPMGGKEHGYDHNYEYRIWGRFSGERAYDPNSNFILPEFILEDSQLMSEMPGFLFNPSERYNPKYLPPRQ